MKFNLNLHEGLEMKKMTNGSLPPAEIRRLLPINAMDSAENEGQLNENGENVQTSLFQSLS